MLAQVVFEAYKIEILLVNLFRTNIGQQIRVEDLCQIRNADDVPGSIDERAIDDVNPAIPHRIYVFAARSIYYRLPGLFHLRGVVIDVAAG